MKKLLRFLAAVFALASISTGVATAQTITNGNGTNSTNTITNRSTTSITIRNSNDVDCSIYSTQNAITGNATAIGNTTVGNVTTGNASNDASLSCLINAGNVSRPTNGGNQTPPAGNNGGGNGGQGGGRVLGSAHAVTTGVSTGSGAARVAALPSTGELSIVENLGLVAASAGALGIAAQAGTLTYRRRALKN